MIDTEILQDIYTDHNLCGTQRRELVKVIAMIKQNRLIELPCAVGDTVWTYWIDDDRLGVERYKPANEPLCILVKDLWGIKFFATKEEAEEKMIAKLKELEDD